MSPKRFRAGGSPGGRYGDAPRDSSPSGELPAK
jgi:hypothetical protein